MRKGAEKQGGMAPVGTRTTGYGWLRPGFMTMPAPANDNRMAPRSLLRRPQLWLWLALLTAATAWIAARL